jgi:hypothetical protein
MAERCVDVTELYPFYTLFEDGYCKTQPCREFTDTELADLCPRVHRVRRLAGTPCRHL